VSATLIVSVVWFARPAAVALAAQAVPPQVETAEQTAPTPIEQALMEHVCSVVPVRDGTPEAERYLVCLRTQLLSLRTDFGKDLSRLSLAERKALDTACHEVRTTNGRDAYLDCLGSELTLLRSKRNPGAVTAAPAMQTPPESTAALAPSVLPVKSKSRSSGLLYGAGALIALVAGGGGFAFLKTRRVSHKCRTCGAGVESSGDLCQKCRHEAAEAVRRAVAARAEQQRLLEEEQQRQKELAEQDEEDRRRKAQEEAAAGLRQQQEKEQEEARKRAAEERRRQQEEARERRMAAASDEEFDPYEVLNLPRGASHDDLKAAYDVAREKADPSQVSHLSAEVQEHFKLRARAVERAFQMLAR
jgi:hypothetical protein